MPNPTYQHEQNPDDGLWYVKNLDTGDWTLGCYETEAAARRMAMRLTADIHLSDNVLRALKTLASTKRLTLHQLAEQAKGRICPFDATEDGAKVLAKLQEHGLARLAISPDRDAHGDVLDERIDQRPTAIITVWGLEWLGRTNDSDK